MTMIERVARAMTRYRAVMLSGNTAAMRDSTNVEADVFCPTARVAQDLARQANARAAVLAMREPTPEMRIAGRQAHYEQEKKAMAAELAGQPLLHRGDMAEAIWQAMLDRAAEQPERQEERARGPRDA